MMTPASLIPRGPDEASPRKYPSAVIVPFSYKNPFGLPAMLPTTALLSFNAYGVAPEPRSTTVYFGGIVAAAAGACADKLCTPAPGWGNWDCPLAQPQRSNTTAEATASRMTRTSASLIPAFSVRRNVRVLRGKLGGHVLRALVVDERGRLFFLDDFLVHDALLDAGERRQIVHDIEHRLFQNRA